MDDLQIIGQRAIEDYDVCTKREGKSVVRHTERIRKEAAIK